MNMRSLGIIRRTGRIFTLSFVLLIGACASMSTQSVPGACPNKADSPIRNFCVVTPKSPNLLWRGARPGNRENTTWLIQQEVRTIVNLELILDDLPVFTQAHVGHAAKHEIGYFRIREWEPTPILFPSVEDDHVAHFLAIVRQQPKPIYVHCRDGQNRTGLMVAAYRVIEEGASEEEAISEMERYQGFWFKADASYIRGLSPERREDIRRRIMEWLPKLKMDAQIVCEKGTCAVSDP